MQGVPPGLDKNLVLCIGLDVLLDSKGDTVALGLDDASFNVLGLRCSQIVNAVVSDRAALSVGRNRDVFPLYQVDTAACLMHDMDKPQASALGKLIRSSKRVQVNPFPEGISLVKKAHALGVHFSYSNRLDILHKHAATVKCAAIKVQLDLNDTRVAAQHGLFLSLIRMMPALKLYLSEYEGENASDMEMSKAEWQDLIVQEAVLDAMRLTTVLPQYEKHLNRAFGPLYKELTIKTLRNHTLWIIDKKQLCTNTGPRPTRKEVFVINLSAVGQETRRRALLECERRFCVNRTEQLNGSVVVKSNHELVCMGLDLRLCACNHLVKAESAEVKNAVCDAYVKYGMNAFEHEHAEKLRIREEAAEEVALGQAEGGSRKKGRADPDRRAMTFGVSSGGTAHGDYGFSDDETEEVSLVVDSVEDDLEGARQARAAELRKEAPLAFSEYRTYNRIQLTAQRGWDQYLPQAPATQSPVPVVGVAAAGVAVGAGQGQQPAAAGFFAPRAVAAAAAATAAASVGPAVETVPVGLK